jgi:hypothetical protein
MLRFISFTECIYAAINQRHIGLGRYFSRYSCGVGWQCRRRSRQMVLPMNMLVRVGRKVSGIMQRWRSRTPFIPLGGGIQSGRFNPGEKCKSEECDAPVSCKKLVWGAPMHVDVETTSGCPNASPTGGDSGVP